MAIYDQLHFRPCVDTDDPDDYRPRSAWAIAVDEESAAHPSVTNSVLIADRVAAGDRVPLHTHPIDEVVIVTGGSAEVRLGEERRVVAEGGVMFVPAGVPHGGRPVSEPVTFIGFFASAEIETTYLERNPAPGTEGHAPQPATVIDARMIAVRDDT